jgi:hypothetical protein
MLLRVLAAPVDVVKVRTQASTQPVVPPTNSNASASSAKAAPLGAVGTQTMACSSCGPGDADTVTRRNMCNRPQAPPNLYNGPAFKVYQNIVQTEGVLGAPLGVWREDLLLFQAWRVPLGISYCLRLAHSR